MYFDYLTNTNNVLKRRCFCRKGTCTQAIATARSLETGGLDMLKQHYSGGAIATGAGAIAGAIAGHTVWGAAIGAAAGAAGGYLYDHHEKAKQAEYEKGYQAGQQSAKKSQ
jgi:osmotically inducible lipoprotein OsmB